MPDNRFFLKERFIIGDTVYLEGGEAHHLSKVMRKQSGSLVDLVNGKNELARAQIQAVSKDQVSLMIESVHKEPFKKSQLLLGLALTKFANLEWVIEKGTELGVDLFWLFPGARSEKPTLSPTQQTRLESIMIAALKQCGRLDLPKMEIQKPLKYWESIPLSSYFGSFSEKAKPLTICEKGDLAFFIGPEGGWSSEEEERFISLGARPLKLHSNTLRAETAAVCALSQASLIQI